MNKFIALLALTLIAACGEKKKSSPLEPTGFYIYESRPLPGSLPPLTSTYVPASLSSKVFDKDGSTFAPLDVISEDARLVFDISTRRTLATIRLRFRLPVTAHGYFELRGIQPSALIDGNPTTVSALTDPDGLKLNFWALGDVSNHTQEHELVMSYFLPADRVTFTQTGVHFLTSMTDVTNAHFLEDWLPVTFEDDSFKLSLALKVMGGVSEQRLFSNGSSTHLSNAEWTLDFPETYTKSSFYVHLTEASGLHSNTITYPGVSRNIPIEVYSESPLLVEEALNQLPALFQEFERDFGAYPHEKFLAYVHSGSGGMEYAGATITSIPALDHELFHSWFARGVMPAEGRSGWIDEAMASWRDNGYFQSTSVLSRAPTNLANYSPFRKSTASNGYKDGRLLLSELDRTFATYGGLKPLMRLFFERYQHRIVTTEEFQLFLESLTMMDLDVFFQRYVYGAASMNLRMSQEDDSHPKMLTHEEILNLR
jgi:hypothetical protein